MLWHRIHVCCARIGNGSDVPGGRRLHAWGDIKCAECAKRYVTPPLLHCYSVLSASIWVWNGFYQRAINYMACGPNQFHSTDHAIPFNSAINREFMLFISKPPKSIRTSDLEHFRLLPTLYRRRWHRRLQFAGRQLAGHSDVAGRAVADTQLHEPRRSDEELHLAGLGGHWVHIHVAAARHRRAVRGHLVLQVHAEAERWLHFNLRVRRVHNAVHSAGDGHSVAAHGLHVRRRVSCFLFIVLTNNNVICFILEMKHNTRTKTHTQSNQFTCMCQIFVIVELAILAILAI